MNNDEEQTWPTAEELQKAEAQQTQLKKRVPKATSEYQAAWIVSDEEDQDQDQEQNVCFSSFHTNIYSNLFLGFQ